MLDTLDNTGSTIAIGNRNNVVIDFITSLWSVYTTNKVSLRLVQVGILRNEKADMEAR